MRIAVIGAGAMGGLFAARLAQSGHAVSLVEVSRPLIEAISTNGLRLTGVFGDTINAMPIGPADHYRQAFDLVIIFTKGIHTTSALTAAQHLIGAQTWALTVQNGIGNVEAIQQFVPEQRIVMGMTNWPSTPREPGFVSVPGTGEVRIWSADGRDSEQLRLVGKALDDAGLNCQLDPMVKIAIWEKLAFNAALNSTAALTGLTVGEMSESAEARDVVFAVVAETVAVALAHGIGVDRGHIQAAVAHAFANHGTHKPSMLQDRLAGRAMEISTITGAVGKAGRDLAVPTPVTSTLASLLTALERAPNPGGPAR
ncbi:ketopantoate reductase family protein [Devosia sp. FKR38]|uniref:ketopantoate reductase family protein n=1 Tax=Devosia sp. FKR38 TaxID=2562312 RepID=UPI0010BFEACD|nr:ketopantoate reductase family protein [Devosia sp. FKR38]